MDKVWLGLAPTEGALFFDQFGVSLPASLAEGKFKEMSWRVNNLRYRRLIYQSDGNVVFILANNSSNWSRVA